SFLMIFVSLAGVVGRIAFSFLSESIGRRASGGLLGFASAVLFVLAGLAHSVFLGGVSLFWMLLIVLDFFADGGFAIVGPYAAEVWPATLRTCGMGSAYGFGGIGKIIGPLGLALIAGSTNVVSPKASVLAIVPAFIYLGAWYLLAGMAYYRSEEHTSELQSQSNLVCRLLLEKKKLHIAPPDSSRFGYAHQMPSDRSVRRPLSYALGPTSVAARVATAPDRGAFDLIRARVRAH